MPSFPLISMVSMGSRICQFDSDYSLIFNFCSRMLSTQMIADGYSMQR